MENLSILEDIVEFCMNENFKGAALKKSKWLPPIGTWNQPTYLVPTFIQDYKVKLRAAMNSGYLDDGAPFSPENDALILFGNMAESKFGKKLRISVVKDMQVDLAFLHDPANTLTLEDVFYIQHSRRCIVSLPMPSFA